ncbi:hypothetical protein ASE90_06670 [Sphingomonas sp. Leaf67]|uniref:HdeA/HdeB family chaperone n=1 Tax=unclassified Sphingomonas TaxID=196159 RepID=UPI0006F3F201|nr:MULTISPECIES: HdeA/HdeB family chaperone [unclassified Sphingomonas]KQN81157.1 hypothetical protein ASE91_09920 [Sphingomonas sp. Leaf62]KQN86958.1 hypothetical protein ASE90_06670 [Sphingomonas sp. Leaf67]
MKKVLLAVVAASTLATGGIAVAQQAKKPWVTEAAEVPGRAGTERTVAVIKSGKNLETVSCLDFNALDENFKPEAIRYAANYGPKGKPHPTLTVSGIESIRPAVVAHCEARPGNHFVQSVHAALKNH